MPSFTSISLTSILLSLAAAAGTFTLTAYLPGHPINGQVINAEGEALFLGLPGPSSFCPSPPVPANQCPAGTKTVFVGALSMWVEVPGGEMGYVAPTGEIKYTGPHSAFMPPGSYVGDFTAKQIVIEDIDHKQKESDKEEDEEEEHDKEDDDHKQKDNDPKGTLMNWKLPGTKTGGIYACPHVPSFVKATYQIYAKTPGFNQKDCIKLKGLLQHEEPTNDFGAWEYT